MNLRHLLTETYVHMPPANIISDLSEQDAFGRVDNAPHSIAEIAAHMNFWQKWFLKRCRGEAEPMVSSAALGWPAVDATSWDDLKKHFVSGLEEAAAYSDDTGVLDHRIEPAIEFPPLAEYTVADVLVHLANHNSHHLGQIVTLRQLLGVWPPPSGSWTW